MPATVTVLYPQGAKFNMVRSPWSDRRFPRYTDAGETGLLPKHSHASCGEEMERHGTHVLEGMCTHASGDLRRYLILNVS